MIRLSRLLADGDLIAAQEALMRLVARKEWSIAALLPLLVHLSGLPPTASELEPPTCSSSESG